MSSPVSTEARPLRRDAARNLERVVDAASALFAEQGLGASVEDIAARAGVGTGTVYRRFPTKDALIQFLVDDLVTEMLALGERALAEPDGAGLDTFLRGMGELLAARTGCLERLWQGGLAEDARQKLRATIRRLVSRAHAAGTLRPEITVTDISVLLWSLQHIVSMTAQVAPSTWRRHLDVLLAGISSQPREIGHRPLTRQEADAVTDGYWTR